MCKKNLKMSKQLKHLLTTREGINYLTSTHFWGPLINWTIPVGTIHDIIYKHPKYISRNITIALMLYSFMFMRFALKIQPRNLLLFACHFVNSGAQITQVGRFINYNYITTEKETK